MGLDLHAPLWGWWLVIPVSLLGLCIFGRIKWRWRVLSMAAVLSVVVAAITAAMWPISWKTSYDIVVGWDCSQANGENHPRHLYLQSSKGGVALFFDVTELPHPPPPGRVAEIHIRRGRFGEGGYYLLWNRDFSATPSDFLEKKLGFQVCCASFPDNPGHMLRVRLISVTVPHWFVLALCAVCPLVWLVRRPARRRRYRLVHGLCLKCGYDLRVQKSGQAGDKCPECGTPVPQAPIAQNPAIAQKPAPAAPASP